MLDELLKYKNLADKSELSFILFEALPLSNNQKISDLRNFCISRHFSIGRTFDSIMALLEFMSLIQTQNGLVSINTDKINLGEIDKDTYFEKDEFFSLLIESLQEQNAIEEFINPSSVQRDQNGQYYIKDYLIPLKFIGLRNLLISLDFFQRNDSYIRNLLYVNPDRSLIFKSKIVEFLLQKEEVSRTHKKITLENLKARVSFQEKAGKDAEIFVLNYEKNRLGGHEFQEKIRRISEDFSNAGYDIESFNDMGSVFIDRFIEVKSFSGEINFYWSQNEVHIAKTLEDKYFLYLVDRNKMSDPSYSPKIIQNPFFKVFESEHWRKEAETWKFSIL